MPEIPSALAEFMAMRKSLHTNTIIAPSKVKKSELADTSLASIIEKKPPDATVCELLQKMCDELSKNH